MYDTNLPQKGVIRRKIIGIGCGIRLTMIEHVLYAPLLDIDEIWQNME